MTWGDFWDIQNVLTTLLHTFLIHFCFFKLQAMGRGSIIPPSNYVVDAPVCPVLFSSWTLAYGTGEYSFCLHFCSSCNGVWGVEVLCSDWVVLCGLFEDLFHAISLINSCSLQQGVGTHSICFGRFNFAPEIFSALWAENRGRTSSGGFELSWQVRVSASLASGVWLWPTQLKIQGFL